MPTEELVIPTPPPLPPDVWVCPRCGGLGTNADGMLCVSATEIRSRPCTPCLMCRGAKSVTIRPYHGGS